MAFSRKLTLFWQSLFNRSRLDAELDQELRDYFEGLVEKKVSAGQDPLAARRDALREMGGMTHIKREVQVVRAGAEVEALWQDIKFACRGLIRNPALALVATLTFALGIGANTAIFSVVNAALIQPLPYKDSGRLTFVWADSTAIGYPRGPLSGPELIDLRRYGASSFSSFAGIWQTTAVITGEGDPQQLRVGWVTANFFRTLGVAPAIGRTFEDSDEGQSAAPSILLSWTAWKAHYGADPAIVGRKIMVWGRPTTVSGVMPEDFRLLFPRDASVPEDLEAWLPFDHDLARRPQRQNFLRIVGRMLPGVGLARAREEVSQIAARISREHVEYGPQGRKLNLVGLQSDGVREVRPGLLALLAGAVVLLLTACLNVASLLVARAAARTRETALRLAIGASHRQILRQCLVEGIILSLAGGIAGVLFGELSLRALVGLRPAALSRLSSARIDGTVLAVAGGVIVLWGLLFSLAPMFEVIRTDVIGGVFGNVRRALNIRHRVRSVLVAAQIAFSVVLLVGGGLMIRTFVAIQRLDPGYTWDRMLSFRLSPPIDLEDANTFHYRLQTTLAALPGVKGVGAVSHLPFDTIPNWGSPYLISDSQDPGTAQFADFRAVSPGYLETVGARLLTGRFFTEADTVGAQPVVVVDDLLARRSWPGENAIGKRVKVDPSVTGRPDRRIWATVIGVVKHMRIRSLVEDLTDQIYMPIRQVPRATTYVVKTDGDPAELAPAIRSRIREVWPQAPVYDIHPLSDYLIAARSGQHFTMILAMAYAVVALALAFVGVFGLISYSVNTRRYEFGVRLALGAQAGDILRLVVREGFRIVITGVAAGAAAAIAVAQFLKAQLYGVAAYDIPTYTIAALVISAAGFLACWLPARRASTSNPLEVMRAE